MLSRSAILLTAAVLPLTGCGGGDASEGLISTAAAEDGPAWASTTEAVSLRTAAPVTGPPTTAASTARVTPPSTTAASDAPPIPTAEAEGSVATKDGGPVQVIVVALGTVTALTALAALALSIRTARVSGSVITVDNPGILSTLNECLSGYAWIISSTIRNVGRVQVEIRDVRCEVIEPDGAFWWVAMHLEGSPPTVPRQNRFVLEAGLSCDTVVVLDAGPSAGGHPKVPRSFQPGSKVYVTVETGRDVTVHSSKGTLSPWDEAEWEKRAASIREEHRNDICEDEEDSYVAAYRSSWFIRMPARLPRRLRVR